MTCEEYVIELLKKKEEALADLERSSIKNYLECNEWMEKVADLKEILNPEIKYASNLGGMIEFNSVFSMYDPEDFARICEIFGLETKKDEGESAGTDMEALNE